MKIQMTYRNQLICPVVLCDSCNEEIEAARMDEAQHASGEPANPRWWGGIIQWVDGQEPLASHKGECAEIIEAGWEREGHIVAWMPLDVALVYLMHNCAEDGDPATAQHLADALARI